MFQNKISSYLIGDHEIILKSDLAGEYPVYIYWTEDKTLLLYSKSIKELLENERVNKPLKVCCEGLSFLLQSGVVPPPMTVYKNIYILGIGTKARIKTKKGKIEVDFEFEFPFMNSKRLQKGEMCPDENLILEMLADATISRMDSSKRSFMFHSAGKDSNSIAIALAEAGCQNDVVLLSHQSKGLQDESEISKSIAKQLGFKHETLREVDSISVGHKKSIQDYFINSPFPCTDTVSLAYPLYAYQLPQLRESNIIDGMGNDVFMGHIPSKSEYKWQNRSRALKYLWPITQYSNSESKFNVIGRTRCEWTGLTGLSFSDTRAIFPEAKNVACYWSNRTNNDDYLDFRASIRGGVIDQEIYIRKVRNFSDSIDANLILPWTNSSVAGYFSKISEYYMFDRKGLKNKLILRKLLKSKIGLDSDKLGKMAFNYGYHNMILSNWDWISTEIYECQLWNSTGLDRVVGRMRRRMDSSDWSSKMAGTYIYRIYLISVWYNHCKYIN